MALRDIKQRIKSIKSTKQITKAMNLVATSKLQRVKGRVISARPFLQEVRKVISSLILQTEKLENVYVEQRPVENTLIIIISGDRGLCGAYNANIIKQSIKSISERKNVKLVVLGSKAVKFFTDGEYEIVRYVTGISDKPFYDDAAQIGALAREMFESGEVDEVFVTHTKFESMLSYKPVTESVLPIDVTQFSFEDEAQQEYYDIMEFEPKAEVILEQLLPKYINVLLFDAMLESAACELAARSASMDSATKNAEDRIEEMSLAYNRARQSVITKEIIEVVAGANALQ